MAAGRIENVRFLKQFVQMFGVAVVDGSDLLSLSLLFFSRPKDNSQKPRISLQTELQTVAFSE